MYRYFKNVNIIFGAYFGNDMAKTILIQFDTVHTLEYGIDVAHGINEGGLSKIGLLSYKRQ